jgi:serine/threonine protein kinase
MMLSDDTCPRVEIGRLPDERLDDLQLTEGLHVAERFRLVRLLGQGGMGSVWLADHLALDIHCAIKFIDREPNSAEARRRFEREAKAAAQLRGQHVVQILDHGVWEGIPYIAMEFLEGEDLAARLERLGRLPHGLTARIISQVAKGLGRAHAAGIVHRDLKPENVFLAKDGDDEIVKVLDFGIAKRSQTSLSEAGTKTGSLLGTPFYMSPEQARGVKGIDHRSDLFSLAIIAYQCVTGRLPFYSEGLGDVLAQIMYEPIPIPSQQAEGVPPAFDAWWRRASERAAEHRFQSAKDLADSLAVALGISETIDIPMLEPRPPELSSPDLLGGRLAAGPASRSGPRSVDHRTIDRPFTRTFDPAPSRSGTRRKKTLLVGAIGLALSAAVLVVSIKSRRSTSGAAEGAVIASGSEVRETTAQAAQPPPPDMTPPKEEAPSVDARLNPGAVRPPVQNGVATVAPGTAAGSAPTTPLPPRRKAAKAAGGTTNSKHDYGI